MAEIVEEQPKQETVMSPVGDVKRNGAKNKDGFVAGQIVEDKDYQEYMAKQRLKK